MNKTEEPLSLDTFLKKQVINPLRYVRLVIAGIVLGFVWRETGIATVTVFALVAIAFEFVDILERWNKQVQEYRYQELQIYIMGIKVIIKNLAEKINERERYKNDSGKTGAAQHQGPKN